MIRKIMVFASVAAASIVASYGHDTRQMELWAVGMLWIVIVMLAQLWPVEKKKRHHKSSDTNSHSNQFENSTDPAEAQ